jgi:acyl transferase domain-containing protein
MSRLSDRTSLLSPLKRALLALEEMQAKLDAMERLQSEPIAIIGMACRFPGNARDPEAFWRILHDGVDAITELPSGRWDIDSYYDPDPELPGKMYTRHGGFLEGIDLFDPQFFGISPREAVTLDPQHRLLLEVSWEALENAGQFQDRLAGSQTGVFVGITSNDYGQLNLMSGELSQIDTYQITGNTLNGATGRLSYTFGFQGPCMAIDTACSSSLVAVHQACRSLSNGECSQALAGGINLILSPVATIALSKARVLSPDGRCRAFDGAANGMVRGEGCGIVVLKRLSDAVQHRDNILALIRGSAVNQDGPSSGLMVPNGPAQEMVIRRALAIAKVDPSQVSYLEAHGTGTSLGDPIEVRALGAVFGNDRPQGSPLLIGSVKTNIGHLEASSGIAGLIKVVLALNHEEIPSQLHFERPNPHISWDDSPVQVVTKPTPWPEGEKSRIAGVSSFGFSGTNAHVVLEEAPVSATVVSEVERPLHLMALSAKTEAALRQLAARHLNHLAANPDLTLEDVCFTANAGRSHFTHRLGVVAASSTEMRESLSAFVAGQHKEGILKGQSHAQPRVAFMFTGQGSQYVGMGHELYRTQPTFRQALDRCDEILRPYLDESLLDVMYLARPESSPLGETAYTQPALFALEYALTELWNSWGIKPSAVMGHSMGEYVAACVAGVFSLEDGLKLTAARARLMQSLPTEGAMVSVFADQGRVAAAILPYSDDVSIAALNGPQHVVISGRRQAVHAVIAGLEGIKTQTLNVSHAFHSILMQPMLEAFESRAGEVTYSAPRISLISNVTGQRAAEDVTTPDYWCRHVSQPVRFASGLETLHKQGYEIFVEIGPKPTLSALGQQCLEGSRQVWLPSLRPGQSDWHQLLQSLGALYVRGVPVDWRGFDRDYARRHVNLPTYPFERERYWIPAAEVRSREIARAAKPDRNPHPLLGNQLHLAATREIRFQSQISPDFPDFLRDHRVFGAVILPATAYLEMVLAAGAAVFKSDVSAVKDVVFHQPLILPQGEERTLQLVLSPDDNDTYSFQILSLKTSAGNDDISWTLHSSGKMLAQSHDLDPPMTNLSALRGQIPQPVSVKDHYQGCRERGIEFGPGFQALERLWQKESDALGEIRLPERLIPAAAGFKLHPVLLDACLQVVAAATPGSPHMYLPAGLDCLRIHSCPGNTLWSHARIRPLKDSSRQTLSVDFHLFAPDGQPIASVDGLHLKRASSDALLRPAQDPHQDWLYQTEWQPKAHLIRLPPD